ncbi:putative metalloprotease CJM1_0395 family protein [Kordiimonas gwangyangensis]|uniref:putative metalloprotease CJM1_0395 family protein n=1 Tax=Kordiimonas gwangyangensis TaxID=288022 RepID=UPI000380ABB7|nr:putative metalloprotease CJM1_0395 family protein [Kordiimonas gwangyangensis]
MTSAVILPSIGPPPPGLKRPDVPENLKPKLPGADSGAPATPQPRPAATQEGAVQPPRNYLSGSTQNLGGAAAVSIQVDEGRIPPAPEPTPAAPAEDTSKEGPKLASELSEDERAQVSDLKARDREVRAHEAAHAATGQGYAGSPQFEYVRGPDGFQYAVGGHVSIDTSSVPDDPEATIEKMRVVKAAALAPARPSGQDRAVAAQAEASIRQAEADLSAKRQEEAGAALEGGQAPEREADQAASRPDAAIGGGFGEAASAELNPRTTVTDTTSLLRPLVAAGSGLNLIA